jgi:hypothetical protein
MVRENIFCFGFVSIGNIEREPKGWGTASGFLHPVPVKHNLGKENMINKGMMLWSDVHKTHKTVAGIFAQAGLAKSILCDFSSTGPYRNSISKTHIDYRVDGRTQSHGVNGLIAAVAKKSSVTVFEKIAVNSWRLLGDWVPYNIIEETESGAVLFQFKQAK